MIVFQHWSTNEQLLKGQNDCLYFAVMGNSSGNNLTCVPLHTHMQVPYCITHLSSTLYFPKQSFWLINCVFFKTVACIILCGDRGKEKDCSELFPECLCIEGWLGKWEWIYLRLRNKACKPKLDGCSCEGSLFGIKMMVECATRVLKIYKL